MIGMKENGQIRKKSVKETFGWLMLGIGVLMLINSLRLCFCNDIWYDELFTVGMAEHSYGELISFTARDVHPPFYYSIVKFILDLCKLIFPSADDIIVIKCVSVLPYFLLFFYALFFVRRRFGIFAAGAFYFCILSMPQMSAYTVEMRMYGWALFFVTAAFFHACAIMDAEGAGRLITGNFRVKKTAYFFTFRRNGHFAALFFYGLAAAYTQYFACVAVVTVYGFLLIRFLVRYGRSGKQDQNALRALKSWLVCVGMSVLAYLPWLFVLIRQVTAVRENYWILPLTWRSLGGCVKFLMKPAFSKEWINVLFAVLFFVVYIGLIVWYGIRSGQKRKGSGEDGTEGGGNRRHVVRFRCALAGCFVLCGLTGFGFAASILVRPVFVYRYMLPAMGCFWFCPVLCLDALWDEDRKLKPLCFLLCAMFLIAGIRDYRAFLGEEEYKAVLMKETEEAISAIAQEAIILYNFDQLQAVMGYYLEQENYLWNAEPETLVSEMFGNKGSIEGTEQIGQWLDEGRTVWFFGSFNSREDICLEWAEEGIRTKEEGSYMLERYWFNIYSVFNP